MKLLLSLLYAPLPMGRWLLEATSFSTTTSNRLNAKPAAGLAMWGAAQYKVPPTTRETPPIRTVAGGASASIIPHEPAGTLCSHPTAPPAKSTWFTLCRSGRGRPSCKAMFSWTAYQSVNPFVDAGSPGSLTLDVAANGRNLPLRYARDLTCLPQSGSCC